MWRHRGTSYYLISFRTKCSSHLLNTLNSGVLHYVKFLYLRTFGLNYKLFHPIIDCDPTSLTTSFRRVVSPSTVLVTTHLTRGGPTVKSSIDLYSFSRGLIFRGKSCTLNGIIRETEVQLRISATWTGFLMNKGFYVQFRKSQKFERQRKINKSFQNFSKVSFYLVNRLIDLLQTLY